MNVGCREEHSTMNAGWRGEHSILNAGGGESTPF